MENIAVFLDTEGTGLSSNDKVINLGAIFFKVVDETTYEYIGHCNIYNMVDRVISIGAQQVHGITPQKLEELSKGISYTQYLDDIYAYLSCAGIVYGHNVMFDYNMIINTYGKVFRPDAIIINTMNIARQYLGRRCNLRDFVKAAQILSDIPDGTFDTEFKTLYGEGGYHGALYDAYMMARAFMLLNNIQWTYPNT